jgi:membrane-associated phospholipid phosphatase
MFLCLPDMIVCISQRAFDGVLASVDYAIFGAHPTVWLERFVHPVMVEVFTWAYVSYFFAPVALGIVLYRADASRFAEMISVGVAVWTISYLGYFLVPALGPRYELAHLQTVQLPGALLAGALRDIMNSMERVAHDAYPSGHVAIAIVVIAYSVRWTVRLRWVLVPMMLMLILSTVYLRYHYVVDVLSGFVLGGGLLFLIPRLCSWWARPREETSVA